MADDPGLDLSQGERHTPHWTFKLVDPTPIPAGSYIVPAKIESDAGREFAALQLAIGDLSFSLECLTEAEKIGLPDPANLHSKSLLFSGVVAYARPFKTGVRKIRLDTNFFTSRGLELDLDLHNYLINMRDKHVAHSVNEFERCEATGIMVGTKENMWRAAGVGFTEHSAIGLSLILVKQAMVQVSAMLGCLTAEADRKGLDLYKAFRAQFEQDGKWKMAPVATFPRRENASKRRT